jgi:rod shape-determining protein MreD
MRTDYILAVLLFFPLLVIQTTIVPLIAVNGVIPDLIIILLVFYTLKMGQLHGTILGFIFGFLFDIITGGLIGSSMLSKTVAGFVTGYFYNENKKDLYLKSFLFVLIVLLGSTIDSFILAFFTTINLNTSIITFFIEQGILPGIYTAVFSIIVIVFFPRRSFS